jgi:hypothetical protein
MSVQQHPRSTHNTLDDSQREWQGTGSSPNTEQSQADGYVPAQTSGAPPKTAASRFTTQDEELTEEEREEYEKGVITWSKCKNWRFWIRKEWVWYYVGFVLLVVLVALMAFFHSSVRSHISFERVGRGKRTIWAGADRRDPKLFQGVARSGDGSFSESDR